MDRKHLTLGVASLAAAFGLLFWNARNVAEQAKVQPPSQQVAPVAPPTVTAPTPAPVAPPVAEQPADQAAVVEMANAVLNLRLTTRGGSVASAALVQHRAAVGSKELVVFNRLAPEAALELYLPDPATAKPTPVRAAFRPLPAAAGWTRFEATLPDGTRIERGYRLRPGESARGAADPHGIEFTVRILPAPGKPAPKFWISTGTWQPEAVDVAHAFQSVLVSDGVDTDHVGLSEFTDSSGFLGIGAHKAVAEHPFVPAAGRSHAWVAAANQYFVASLCPDPAHRGGRSEVLALPVDLSDGSRTVRALASWETPLAADGSRALDGVLYVGPKEYGPLSALSDGQVDTLQFVKLLGFIGIGWMAKLLLAVLGGVHWVVDGLGAWSWGFAILLLTLLIKLLTWPLTAAQMRAAKNMAKFSGPMKALQEKYKKDPERLQKEMLKLYREHGINPLAGCFPILVQMPIFFGLYSAFQTAPEMRLQSFLWIADLAQPDTIASLGSIPVNPMPLLMGITMWISMRMTPTTNADETQKTIMNIMLLMFPLICYTMPAALTLYWTFQNVLQIGQTWLIQRRDAKAAPAAKA